MAILPPINIIDKSIYTEMTFVVDMYKIKQQQQDPYLARKLRSIKIHVRSSTDLILLAIIKNIWIVSDKSVYSTIQKPFNPNSSSFANPQSNSS
jgi:hypothetical protein